MVGATTKNTAYATPQQVIDEWQGVTDNIDRSEIAKALERSHRRMESMVGRWHTETICPEQSIDEYNLELHPLLRFVDAVYRDEALVETTDYTVDLAQSTFTLTSSGHDKVDGRRLRLYYVPTVYQDLEITLAVKKLLSTRKVVSGAENTQETLDVLNTEIMSLVNEINRYGAFQSGPSNNRWKQYRWH